MTEETPLTATQQEEVTRYYARMFPDLGCKIPTVGWYCSREPGHQGPCFGRATPLTAKEETPTNPYFLIEYREGGQTRSYVEDAGSGWCELTQESYRARKFQNRIDAEATIKAFGWNVPHPERFAVEGHRDCSGPDLTVESRSSQPSSSSEITDAIDEFNKAILANERGPGIDTGERARLNESRIRLESLYLEQREDAARWRAVLPTLTVRNVGLAAYASTNEFSPDFTWRKTWLESRKPLEGVALNPIEFADALRALSTKGTAEK